MVYVQTSETSFTFRTVGLKWWLSITTSMMWLGKLPHSLHSCQPYWQLLTFISYRTDMLHLNSSYKYLHMKTWSKIVAWWFSYTLRGIWCEEPCEMFLKKFSKGIFDEKSLQILFLKRICRWKFEAGRKTWCSSCFAGYKDPFQKFRKYSERKYFMNTGGGAGLERAFSCRNYDRIFDSGLNIFPNSLH